MSGLHLSDLNKETTYLLTYLIDRSSFTAFGTDIYTILTLH